MKKTLSCLVMIISLLLSTPAIAANTRISGSYTYEIKGNGTITITMYDWSQNDGDIYIPNMIDGYVVTSIGERAFSYRMFTKDKVGVTLPEGIVSIGDSAFSSAGLSYINIPSSLQVIGDGAFYGCPDMQFKIVPNHPYFATIEGNLYGKTQKELIAVPCARKVIIPEGIRSIRKLAASAYWGTEAASKDASLDTQVSFPSTLISIGDSAFAGRNLVYEGNLLPQGLISIGERAFYKCSLGDVEIPTTVTTIGKGSFENIDNLGRREKNNTISIPEDSQLTVIPENAFLNARDHLINIYATNLKSIENYAFAQYEIFSDSRVQVSLGDGVLKNLEKLGEYAFHWDKTPSNGTTLLNYQSLPLPEKMTEFPAGFNLLIEIPSNIKTISSNAFTVPVTDYFLPNTLTQIAVDAFPVGSTFVVEAGTYAELWCSENGFGYSIEGQDNLDWLNN